MNLQLDVGAATDVGKVREHNEDFFTTTRFAGGDLLVVCDGMGGHAAGDIASKIACSSIVANVLPMRLPDPREVIYRAAQKAHEEVLEVAEASPEKQGMGTTCVVALIRDAQMYVGNVGDSRAYLVRGGQVKMLSVDQTKVQAMVDKGILTLEEAKKHPEAGVLSQAIGQKNKIEPYVDPETTGIALELGDVVLLCSDGVYDCMDADLIARLSTSGTAEQAARALVEYATANDGKDNATAVVARVISAAEAANGAGSAGGSQFPKGQPGVGTAATTPLAPTLIDEQAPAFPSPSNHPSSRPPGPGSVRPSHGPGTFSGQEPQGTHSRVRLAVIALVGALVLVGLSVGLTSIVCWRVLPDCRPAQDRHPTGTPASKVVPAVVTQQTSSPSSNPVAPTVASTVASTASTQQSQPNPTTTGTKKQVNTSKTKN